ncbi:MAG: hypothetical protein OIN66_02860 [Candidatus Methanoperedens sp.]|nr:hypothetical protein [Candidatus Methanoperedens sp.]
MVVRIDPETKEVVGFTILNFEKRFERRGTSETLTLTAVFEQVSDAAEAKGEPQINADHANLLSRYLYLSVFIGVYIY